MMPARDILSGPNILVINDDGNELDVFSLGLRLEGLQATGTTSAAEALDLLSQRGFDVALIDLMITEINGLELARRIRLKHPSVVTILMSDYLLSPVQLAKANTGVVGFVPKPCRLEEVARFIRAKLESKSVKDGASAAHNHAHADPQAPFDVLSVQFAF